MSLILPFDPIRCTHILNNLRREDMDELRATRDDVPFGLLPEQIQHLPGAAWIAVAADGEPVAALGAWTMWPGVANAWAFGTKRWPEVGLTLTKHVLRDMVPAMTRQGYHRVECRALATHEKSRAWLSFLGFKVEGYLSMFGRHGEDFILYARTRPDARPVQN